MYSFHSSPDEKNKLLSTLAQHGIETTVDRSAKKQRIRDWIQSSVIAEEEEVSLIQSKLVGFTHPRYVYFRRTILEQPHRHPLTHVHR